MTLFFSGSNSRRIRSAKIVQRCRIGMDTAYCRDAGRLRAAALDLGVKHVKERKAFGVTIGWFQGIQHRLADLFAAGEGARLLVLRAAWARKNEMGEAADLATMALLFLADLSFKTCREALQFHGGYGYTLDFDIQLYIRRAKTWPLSIGDLRSEYQRLAARMYPE